MARRIIVATLNYSSTANRDAALSRITSAVSAVVYTSVTTAVLGGISTSGNSVNISIEIDDRDEAFNTAKAIYDAAVATNRQTSGYMSVNRI